MPIDDFLLSNLRSETTGLPFVVWISVGQDSSATPCIWVSARASDDPSGFVAVAVEPQIAVLSGRISETDLTALKRWIAANRIVIELHWTGTIDSVEAITRVQRIEWC